MKIEDLKLPRPIIDILKRGAETLNPPQALALQNGLLEGKNLVIASPTASGKTLIAEMAFLKNFLNHGKTVYLVPLRALGSEKYEEFKKRYSSIGMKIALSVGDMDSGSQWLGNYDLIIASNEKMDSLLRHDSKWISSVSLIICDEIHVLNDSGRGPTLEIVLTRLKEIANAQVLALSATISNADEIAKWLGAKLVRSDFRPVKLYPGICYPEKDSWAIEYHGKDDLKIHSKLEPEIAMTEDTVKRGKQALLFLSTRRNSEAAAEKVSFAVEKNLTKEEKEKLRSISKEITAALSAPTKQCKRLAGTVARGAAFHHAGLVAKQRKIIEDNFRSGLIKILASTSSLAYGMNLPAWRVVVRDMKRFSGYGSDFLPVLDVQQMCVPADAEIMMDSGIYEKAEAVVEKLNTSVISINPNFHSEKNKITNKYTRYTSELFQFHTKSGRELKATPEHPILALSNGKPEWIPINKIKIGSKVAVIKKITSCEKKILFIDLLDNDIYVKDAEMIIRKILKNGKITYKQAAEYLKIPFKTMKAYGYNKAVPLKHVKELAQIADIDNQTLAEILLEFKFKTKYGNTIKLAKYVNEEFGWLVGLIAAEGSIVDYTGRGKWNGVKYSRIKISNTNKEIIKKIETIYKKFNIHFYKGLHKGGFNSTKPNYSIEVCNQTLVKLIKQFGIYSGKKSHTLRALNMFSMPDNLVAGYLAGAFDGDGNVSRAPCVRLSSKSRLFLKDCKGLLLRFGIRSSIIDEKMCHTLLISGKDRINKFFNFMNCIRLKSKELKYQKMTRPEINIGDLYFDKVISIEQIKLKNPIKVFNISVDKNENYVCNDFVVHNCGRAGRPAYDTEGEAILVAKSEREKEQLKEKYIFGEPEPIYSKLSSEPMLRMHVLALIASDAVKTKNEIKEFFSKTFFAHQYGDIDQVMKKVEKILAELESYNFIEIEKEDFILPDFVPAFSLAKDVKLKATKVGKRVSELYVDPWSANMMITNLKPMTDLEYIMTINRCLEMLPMIRTKSKEYDQIEDELERCGLNTPDVWNIDYEDFIDLFKTSIVIRDWMNEFPEGKLLDTYGIAPGELHNRMTNAEWLLYSARELALLLEKRPIANKLNKIRMRIKHGVKEELLRLVKLKGIGRVRARMLYKNGIKGAADIRNSTEKLEKILGKGVARQVSEQLDKPGK